MNRTQKRWWRRPSRLIPLTSILLALIALVGFIWASRSGLQNEIEAIRARGLPTTPAELNAWYKSVPPSENRAEAILAARAKFVLPAEKQNRLFSSQKIPKGEPLPPLMSATAAEFVENNRETIQLLHAAARLDRARYPVDFTNDAPDLAPHSPEVDRMVYLLRWDVLLKTEKGDAVGALESLKVGFAVAASFEEEPLSPSILFRFSCLERQIDAAEHVLNRVSLEDKQLNELAALVQRAEDQGKRGFHRMIVGDRVIALRNLNSVTFNDFGGLIGFSRFPTVYKKLPRPLRHGLFKMRQAVASGREAEFLISTMGKWEQTAQLDDAEMWREVVRLQSEVDEMIKDGSTRYVIAEIMLPPMEMFTRKHVLTTARLRCARAAIAVERSRIKNNGLIPMIATLAPEFIDQWPRDPVSNEPLELELPAAGGFRVIAKASTALAKERRSRTSTNLQEVAFTIVR